MINILDENYEVIFTINNGAIFQGDTKLFEIQNGNQYVDSVNGGYYELDSGVIKSWGVTISYNSPIPNIAHSLCFQVLYHFVTEEDTLKIKDALNNLVAEKGEDEEYESGVIKS